MQLEQGWNWQLEQGRDQHMEEGGEVGRLQMQHHLLVRRSRCQPAGNRQEALLALLQEGEEGTRPADRWQRRRKQTLLVTSLQQGQQHIVRYVDTHA